ncbi:hypothetical protein [Flaviflexus equikiangi]|uniref:Uncharacterized protein n=1 Tax=Flaviflexus equikiangi TaxID=2758573 RepID=A0ABS2TGZ7_9ACTO|nr:hypothetical protein [Flaviflexus equikiangi]MBM9433924.1 hypothetical protein [Flaviflexus equikiangi]
MNSLAIDGEIDDLFSHMVLMGLGSIIEDAGVGSVSIWWNSDERACISVHEDLVESDIAECILAHARRHTSDSSWLRDRFQFYKGKKLASISPVGPRTASPDTEADWLGLADAHESSLDKQTSTLEHRFVQGMGYRSWWYYRSKVMRADIGANIWEMRTRNRGTEFIADRLLPLAEEISGWSVEDVINGVFSGSINDAIGSNSLDSRSATGFRIPGPVDNARAWCALWALSMLPVVRLADPSSSYPAYLPRKALQDDVRHQLLIPVPNAPVTMARMRAVLRSRRVVAAADQRGEAAEITRKAAWDWLHRHGMAALVRFPVQYVGSDSAPERQALTGIRVWP